MALRAIESAGVLLGVRVGPPRKTVCFANELVAGKQAVVTETAGPSRLEPSSATAFFGSNESNESFPASFVAEISDGRVARHGVISADGRLIGDLSVEAGVRAEGVTSHRILRARSLPRPKRLRGRAVALNSTYASNYYHWLLDVLPRLGLLRDTAPDDFRTSFLLFESVDQPFQKETLEAIGIGYERVLTTMHDSFVADTLVVPSLAGHMIHPPCWAVEQTRRLLLETEPVDLPATRRLYVSRGAGARRSLANEVELVAGLKVHGFEVVTTEGLSVKEQVELFRSAQSIVSAHGAALANLVFCEPESKVVELFPAFTRPACYYLISRHRGLRYRPIAGQPRTADPHSDFTVEPSLVLAALDSMTSV